MLSHKSPKLIHLFQNTVVRAGELVEVLVDTLHALLPKKSKSHMPLPQPRYDMFFKHVHLWEDSGMWELFPVVCFMCPSVGSNTGLGLLIYIHC